MTSSKREAATTSCRAMPESMSATVVKDLTTATSRSQADVNREVRLRILLRMRMLALCVVLCLLVACGGGEAAGISTGVPATVTGTVVSVEPAEGDVESFVLEQDGERFELRIADDVDY